MSTLRDFALTGAHCGLVAQQYAVQLLQQLPLLQLPADMLDRLPDQPLSPTAHELLKYKNSIPDDAEHRDLRKLATEAAYAAISLRGADALRTGEDLCAPYDVDLLTSDMNDITIPGGITEELYHLHLGPKEFGTKVPSDSVPEFPVPGFLFGYHERPMFTLQASFEDQTILLPFFVDTGGQQACINKVSWRALAPLLDTSVWTANTFKTVSLHGIDTKLHLGTGRTDGVNMVGSTWLTAAGLMLLCDYSLRGQGCLLVKATPQARQLFPQLPMINRGR